MYGDSRCATLNQTGKAFGYRWLLDLEESSFDERKATVFTDFACSLTNIVVCFLTATAVTDYEHAGSSYLSHAVVPFACEVMFAQ
jgi:hypothetical protein